MGKIIKVKKKIKNLKDGVLSSPPTVREDIRRMILQTRQRVSVMVNAELVLLYWHIGRRIKAEVLKGVRAEYGKEIVVTLSQQLAVEFGSGFSKYNLSRMINWKACHEE